MVALKDLMTSLGAKGIECRQDGTQLQAGPRGGYIFNAGIAGIDKADLVLLIGTNPRIEAPVLNARIRRRALNGGLKVGVIGEAPEDLTYPIERLGTNAKALDNLGSFGEALKAAKTPLIIVGQGALARPDGAAILAKARALTSVSADWNGFCVLHTAAARVGGLDLGLTIEGGVEGILKGCEDGSIDLVYLLAADEFDTSRLGKAFVVYQGHHGDAGAHRADVVLPGAAYTEKPGVYVNTEGRVQLAKRASYPPGEAREDWAILRALSGVLGKALPYDTADQVRSRLVTVNPVFAAVDQQKAGPWGKFGKDGAVSDAPLRSPIANFYMTCPISRASRVMADCTAQRRASLAVAAE
jgi:NADH-quinone oxidoreductase subunit G